MVNCYSVSNKETTNIIIVGNCAGVEFTMCVYIQKVFMKNKIYSKYQVM